MLKEEETDMPQGPSKAEMEKFQAEDDVRTLVRASEIRADKARFRRATKAAQQQLKALQEVSNE